MTLKDVVILSRTIQALYLDGEAGAELWFECQESGQGDPQGKYERRAAKTLCGCQYSSAHTPFFSRFTVQQPCALITEKIFVYA